MMEDMNNMNEKDEQFVDALAEWYLQIALIPEEGFKEEVERSVQRQLMQRVSTDLERLAVIAGHEACTRFIENVTHAVASLEEYTNKAHDRFNMIIESHQEMEKITNEN